MRGKHEKQTPRIEWSKLITLAVILLGFAVTQECFLLMFLCITRGFTSAAAWLTAAVGLAEVVIGTGLSSYLSLCKSDHKEGGITYAKAKANNFNDGRI